MIDTIFLAWTNIVPPYFIFGVGAVCLIHAGFFTIFNDWL